MSFRKQKPEGELIYKRVPVVSLDGYNKEQNISGIDEIINHLPEESKNRIKNFVAEQNVDAYWAGFRAGATARVFCKCSKEEKHGSTSAMHCNHCGGVEPSETWLKPGMNQIE
jgi:hypothetical protein